MQRVPFIPAGTLAVQTQIRFGHFCIEDKKKQHLFGVSKRKEHSKSITDQSCDEVVSAEGCKKVRPFSDDEWE